jgi:hypothetical protein
MLAESCFCCFVNAGGNDESNPQMRVLKASTRTQRLTPQKFEMVNLRECFGNQPTLVSRSEFEHRDMLSVHNYGSSTPRSLWSSHTSQHQTDESRGERSNSRLNVTPPHDGIAFIAEMNVPHLRSNKYDYHSRENSPRPLVGSSAGSFVPEMSEAAQRRRNDFGGGGEARPPPMEGWTEDDQRRFLTALRSTSGRRTGLGFHEWMKTVAAEVPPCAFWLICDVR